MTESTLSPMAAAVTAKLSDAQANLRAETQGLLQNIQNGFQSEAEGLVRNVENKVQTESEGYMQKIEDQAAGDLSTLPSVAHRPPPSAYMGPTRGSPKGSPRGAPQGGGVGRGRGGRQAQAPNALAAPLARSLPSGQSVLSNLDNKMTAATTNKDILHGATRRAMAGEMNNEAVTDALQNRPDLHPDELRQLSKEWPPESSQLSEVNTAELHEGPDHFSEDNAENMEEDLDPEEGH